MVKILKIVEFYRSQSFGRSINDYWISTGWNLVICTARPEKYPLGDYFEIVTCTEINFLAAIMNRLWIEWSFLPKHVGPSLVCWRNNFQCRKMTDFWHLYSFRRLAGRLLSQEILIEIVWDLKLCGIMSNLINPVVYFS